MMVSSIFLEQQDENSDALVLLAAEVKFLSFTALY
jgi:hypothetical protein